MAFKSDIYVLLRKEYSNPHRQVQLVESWWSDAAGYTVEVLRATLRLSALIDLFVFLTELDIFFMGQEAFQLMEETVNVEMK